MIQSDQIKQCQLCFIWFQIHLKTFPQISQGHCGSEVLSCVLQERNCLFYFYYILIENFDWKIWTLSQHFKMLCPENIYYQVLLVLNVIYIKWLKEFCVVNVLHIKWLKEFWVLNANYIKWLLSSCLLGKALPHTSQKASLFFRWTWKENK